MDKLPIDVLERRPVLRFKWEQEVSTFGGSKSVACQGMLPGGIDTAVAALIRKYRDLERKVTELKEKNEELLSRLSAIPEKGSLGGRVMPVLKRGRSFDKVDEGEEDL